MSEEWVPASRCAWCSAAAPVDATVCPACGAALAQRESIGDLLIPGLTSVDPALLDAADRPMHLAGPSPTQGIASGVFGVALGGPVGLAALGGLAIVGAAEYASAGSSSGNAPGLQDVGRPSAVTLQALERLGANPGGNSDPSPDPANDPWRDEPGRTAPEGSG